MRKPLTTAQRAARTIYERHRVWRLRYGLSLDDVNAMLARQDGCAICHTWDEQSWCVDHDHKCCPYSTTAVPTCMKCVRGILCQRCNKGIGLLRDDVTILRSAINYLSGRTS